MDRALTRLERVLDLEKQQGYQNKAVVGGVRQFAVFWVTQAQEEAVDEADRALVEQIGEVLGEYGRLPGAGARAKAIESLETSIARRRQRHGQTAAAQPQQPEKPPAAKPQPPKPEQKPESKPEQKPEPKPEQRPAQPQPEKPRPEPQKPAQSKPAPPAKAEAAPQPKPRPEKQKPAPPAGAGEQSEFVEEQEAPDLEDDLLDVVESEAEAFVDDDDVELPEPDAQPDPVGLSKPVSTLKGVGPKIAEKLNRLGAESIWDLLYLFPRRYDDYTLLSPINRLKFGEQVTVIGTVWQTTARRTRTNQSLVESVISDGTGKVQATWFNQPWLAEQLPAGMPIVLSGKVELFLGRPVFNSPEWEPLEVEPLRTRRIVPVYPLTEGLAGGRMREIMGRAVRDWAIRIPDPLPMDLRRRRRLVALPTAVQQMHFPDSQAALRRSRRRLAFDELLVLQLGMEGLRRTWTSHPGVALSAPAEDLEAFTSRLPYELTGAQQRVVAEIAADMARERPMNRLLQGDVGAGKTVVAAAAMVVAARAGAQAALMAPTEILAEQHYKGLNRLLEPIGIRVALLTGSTPAAEKTSIYERLAAGEIDVVIGTHALIQPAVGFKRLGLAVIDEQHRFGVEQRGALREKGPQLDGERVSPHLLVMSATPIPRTLALSIYGDLDLSILDEMPPGRQEIKTRWIRPSESERAYRFVRRQIEEGRQAFIVYPLVEDSDAIDAKSAVAEYDRLQREIFPEYRLGLIHGRMKPEEKESAMRAFHEGATHILVATSVIEVGVDVPNSTVMVIEGAERFGLAQLHQFRGRVGRGEFQSYCILIADDTSADTEQRLSALEATNDGFLLAEKDLELRGPGEFFGWRQSGIPTLRHASLLHDRDILEMAQEEATTLFERDPELALPEHRILREHVAQFWERSADVS